MNKKLLNKTTSSFLIFSVIILLFSAPLFYNITETLYLDETDETLLLHKEEFLQYYLPTFDTTEITAWNKYNRNIKITPSRGLKEDAFDDKTYYDELEDEDEPYRELKTPITIQGKNYTYEGRINQIEKKDIIVSTATVFFFVILILLSGILIISKIISKRIWKPFYDTLKEIEDFEIDKYRQPDFMPTDIDEFYRLNKSIERLIEKNILIYKNQKEFVENAAHELQTPLALFQSKIDTMIQTSGLSKEQSLLLNALNNDVFRLNRLNKNLLLLSKIENEYYLEKQSFSIESYINKNIAFFKEQAEAKNIEVTTDFSESLIVNGNPALIEVMINNLFLNAIRHNNRDGKISIETLNDSLIFKNTGNENALAIDKLFNRFSKADPSAKGNGLGLAIIKKIAALNDWNIVYAFDKQFHVFTVKF